MARTVGLLRAGAAHASTIGEREAGGPRRERAEQPRDVAPWHGRSVCHAQTWGVPVTDITDIMRGDRGRVLLADNLPVLRSLPDSCIDLIYIDPPFNTGKRQTLHRIRTLRDVHGGRTGFQGQRYRT